MTSYWVAVNDSKHTIHFPFIQIQYTNCYNVVFVFGCWLGVSNSVWNRGKRGVRNGILFLSNLSIIVVFGCCPSVANRGWSSVKGGPGYAGIPLFCLHFRFIVVFYCCRILKCSLYFNRARRGIIFIQYTIVLPYRTPRCIRHACTHTWKVKTKFGSNVDCKV